jgi:formylglycine-generating enzyme required for sulfatase activity
MGDREGIPGIEEIDFGGMVEYQRIIMGNTQPLMERVIEIEARRPKKKTLSPLLVLGAVAAAAGVLVFLILKNKRASERSGFPTDSEYDTRELGITWVEIPSGRFMMGDNFNEGEGDEQPVHPVYLSIYYISRYEVTFEQYDRFCRDTGREPPPDNGWGRGSRPVINVSWYDANSFCDWLSKKTGKDIHLPTEAQWEKAARGTDQRRYPWGNASPTCIFTNYGCRDRTDPVGSYPQGVSPYGVHDMAGNAAEWCRDAYAANYYSYSPYRDPQGADIGIYVRTRVVRGGSWNPNSPLGLSLRSADRGQNDIKTDFQQQDIVYNDLGFRIAMEFN